MKKLISLLFLALMVTSCGFELVDDGFVGIKKTNGKIEKEEYAPGLHFYTPIISRIFEMEIREKAWSGKVSAYSSDNQIIDATFKVNYKPNAKQMAELYINQGDDYINVILPQRVESAIKDIIGKHKATNLVTVRQKVNKDIKMIIDEKLKGTYVSALSFEITSFDYDDDFERAVKNKIVAKERAIEERNKTVQIQEQAKQKIEMAKAEAKAIKEQAAALRENKSIVELKAVEKWDGKLPVYMLGNGTTPFLNLNKK